MTTNKMVQGSVMKVERKLELVSHVLKILHDFCRNKLGKSGSDQKFGDSNPARQQVKKYDIFSLLKYYYSC